VPGLSDVIGAGNACRIAANVKDYTMRLNSALLAGALALVGAHALADDAVDRVRADNAALHQDRVDVHADRRAVHHDNVGIWEAKRAARHERNVARFDRREAQHDLHVEEHLAARGDLRDAEQVDRARRHALDEAHVAARQAGHDGRVAAIERRQRTHDDGALHDARVRRQIDAAQRDDDAARIR
jgi:hypothetical protein